MQIFTINKYLIFRLMKDIYFMLNQYNSLFSLDLVNGSLEVKW